MHAWIFERRYLVESRSQTHDALTVQVAFRIDVAERQRECKFGLQHMVSWLRTHSGSLQFLVSNLECFDGDGGAGGIEPRARPLGWESVDEVPADLFCARFVTQHDRAVLSFGLAVDHCLAPLKQLVGISDAAFECDG